MIHFRPPADLLSSAPAPKPLLVSVSWDGTPSRYAPLLDKIPEHNHLRVHVGSLAFNRRNSLRFRYRLLPAMSQWKETKDPDIDLGRVQHGTHDFQLESATFEGPWSAPISKQLIVVSNSSNFTLLPAWTSAFLVLGISLLAWKYRARQFAAELPDLRAWQTTLLQTQPVGESGQFIASRYELVRVLARGGFGTVWLASDRECNQSLCALKIFDQSAVPGEWLDKRAQSEIAALSRLKHANIVKLYGHGLTSSHAFFIVMEFVDGITLRELLSNERLTRKRIASFLLQIGSALTELHSRSIFHRDLKPENIMIRQAGSDDEQFVLIDFSIALLKDPGQTLQTLSKVVGSLDYMAPEQVVGFADASTDIFSLTKMLLEMLTGQRFSVLVPNPAIDLPDQVKRVLAVHCSELPEEARQQISAALAFDPTFRPHNALEFSQSLASVLCSSVF